MTSIFYVIWGNDLGLHPEFPETSGATKEIDLWNPGCASVSRISGIDPIKHISP